MTRDAFGVPLGQHIPGGCDDCNAVQVLTEYSPGIYRLDVQHDETCPYWRSRPNYPPTPTEQDAS